MRNKRDSHSFSSRSSRTLDATRTGDSTIRLFIGRILARCRCQKTKKSLVQYCAILVGGSDFVERCLDGRGRSSSKRKAEHVTAQAMVRIARAIIAGRDGPTLVAQVSPSSFQSTDVLSLIAEKDISSDNQFVILSSIASTATELLASDTLLTQALHRLQSSG